MSTTNNYTDVQMVYYLTNSSIPKAIVKWYNADVDRGIVQIFFFFPSGKRMMALVKYE